MRNSIVTAAMLVLLAACAGVSASAPLAPAESETEFVELGIDEFSSPFTKETVVRLNSIVGRSLASIQAYDGSVKKIEESIDASLAGGASAAERADAMKGLAKLEILSREAKAARKDLNDAEAELKSGDEKYNEAILAGMVAFVVKVDDELRIAVEVLNAKLGAN